jgi:outer membrane receptor for ferrienterochelin and colicin
MPPLSQSFFRKIQRHLHPFRIINRKLFMKPFASSTPRLAPLAAAVVAVFSGTPHAQEPKLLNTVVITATTYEQPIQDVQASVQVIGPRDLQATTGSTLGEALKQAVGVDTRGTGNNSTASMRGMGSKGTLILFDGLRRTQKYGSSDINLYGTEDVERLEIVRGPMSALYGADASGGVINVITRMPKFGSGVHGGASATYGELSNGQRETTLWKAGLEYGGEVTAHRLSIEQRNRGAFREDPGSYAVSTPGADEQYLTYHGGLRIAPGHQIRLTYEHVDQDNRGDAQLASAPFTKFEGYEKEKRHFGSLNYTGEVGPGILTLDAAVGTSNAKTTRAYPLIEETDYDQTQYAARYMLPLGANTVTLGVAQQNDKLKILNNTSKAGDRTNDSVFIQNDWKFAQDWTLLAGVRYDRFNDFDSAMTPRLSLAYRPGNWSFRAGYGEAFRAPTVLEQYSSFRRSRFLIVGNENLVPESSKTFEAAVGYATERVRAELALYRTKSTDLITTRSAPRLPGDPAGVTSRSLYTNIGSALIEGAELSGAWQITNSWSLQGGFEHISARNEQNHTRLEGRPGNIARTGIRFDQGVWSTDLLARYYFNYYNTHNTLRGVTQSTNYGTTDLKISYRVDKNFSIAGGINNLFDSQTPNNWGAMYVYDDPSTRFGYISGSFKF